MAKSKLKISAKKLRFNGFGIKTIARKLGVSSSTVSLWCRDIQLTEAQFEELSRRARDPYYGARKDYILEKQASRLSKTKRLLQEGINRVKDMKKGELFYAGVALYWAEGFKKDNLAGFSNSDPHMVKFFIRWLEQCCNIPHDRLKFRLGVNELYRNKVEIVENYWSKFLNIPVSQFQKPFFQKVKWQKVYDHPENYHGVLRVRVSKSTDFLRLIHGWIEGLKMNT